MDYIDEIKELVEKLLAKHNLKDYAFDNNIYYYNGNDGTDFDLDANGRTCEFFVWSKDEYGLIKMWFTSISRISKSGKTIIEYYVYDPKEWNKIIEHGTEKSSNTLKSIGRDLYMTRDKKHLIDAPIATFEVEESKSAESEPQLTTDRMAAGQWYESLEESYKSNWENLIKKLDELDVDWDYRDSSWNPEIKELITIDGQDALALCDDGICYGEELMYWDDRFNVMKLLKTLYEEDPEMYPSLKKILGESLTLKEEKENFYIVAFDDVSISQGDDFFNKEGISGNYNRLWHWVEKEYATKYTSREDAKKDIKLAKNLLAKQYKFISNENPTFFKVGKHEEDSAIRIAALSEEELNSFGLNESLKEEDSENTIVAGQWYKGLDLDESEDDLVYEEKYSFEDDDSDLGLDEAKE